MSDNDQLPVPFDDGGDGENETENSGEQTVLGPDGDVVDVPEQGPRKADANEIERAERRNKVLEMRKLGATMRQIAKKLEVSTATVCRDLHSALEELHATEVKDAKLIRSLDSDRIDTMLFAVWPQAKQGVPVAVDLVLKLMEKRHKMYGVDAAVKVDILMQEERQQVIEILQANLPEEDFKRVLGVLAVSGAGQ